MIKKNSVYEFLLNDNVKLLKRIFLEKEKGNIDNVVYFLKQLNANNKDIHLLESGGEQYGG